MPKKKRISLEIIRIIAISLVIYNHTGESGYELYNYASNNVLWILSIILGVVCKAGVPLFFMISGTLLLGKDESIADIVKNRVLRYAIIIILFSFIYYVRMYIQHPEYGFSIKFFIRYIYEQPFIIPYWFLYSYLAFLLMLPFLRAIVKGIKEEHYIMLAIIMLITGYAVLFEHVIEWNSMYFSFVLLETNVIYPVLGYGIANVLSDEWFKQKIRNFVIILFGLNCAITIFMTWIEKNELNLCSETYIAKFCFVPAVSIFYLWVYLFEKKKILDNRTVEKFVFMVGSSALCIYLFEDMLRSDIFLPMIRWSNNQWVNFFMIIPYTACIIFSGTLISLILRRIPIIKKLKL